MKFYDKKISIIVPVYNVEQYLPKCLDSLVNQTLEDIEIICINDGSTDNSLKILEEYAQKDNRIIIINQDNQGQGVARNRGLEAVQGEYIMFVDSDDWIETDAAELIYNRFKETNVDIIQFDYTMCKANCESLETKTLNDLFEEKLNIKINGGSILNFAENMKKSFYVIWFMVWDKAYSTKFIRDCNITFPTIRFAEDNLFSIKACIMSESIFYLSEPLYNYRQRLNSAMHKVVQEESCVFENAQKVKDFLLENGLYQEYEQAYNDFVIKNSVTCYSHINPKNKKDFLQKCREYLSDSGYKKMQKYLKIKHSFFENIFSLKNVFKDGCKHKNVRILGIDFCFKVKDKNLIEEVR